MFDGEPHHIAHPPSSIVHLMSLADRLRDARHARFVGRADELARFAAALGPDAPPFHVLHVWGPGGVGKTALLREFEELCGRKGVPVRYLDAREIETSPEGFLAALGQATPALLALPGEAVGDVLPPALASVRGPADPAARHVLLVDTYEAMAGLDGWVREAFLPQSPETLVVVFAGRDRPAAPWRTDAGWRALAEWMPLRNLTPDEGRALLATRGVPAGQHGPALAFTRGHPLALALVAEAVGQAPAEPFAPEDAPDVVGTLLRRFVDEVPGPDHRLALEACALARTTTEALLAALLERPAAPELFAWLRSLSFIQESRDGLFPHDLARDVLVADLRWRHPDRYEALHARARRHYTVRLQAAAAAEQQRALADYAFLYRDNPVAGPLIASLRQRWREQDAHADGPPRPADGPALRAMVEQHEGPDAARIADWWLERQPDGFEVFRDADGAPRGLLVRVALEAATEEDEAADPAVAAARAALRRLSPLREGERALLFRFWMDRDQHQQISAVQSLVFARTVWHYLTTPVLAFSLLPCRVPHGWGPILAFAGLRRLPAADYETDGQRFEAFGHDWRTVPPEAWLAALAERSPDAVSLPEPAEPPLVVLSRPAFADAVKEALKAYAVPHRLRGNPLLRSRLVAERADGEDEADRITALRALIAEAVGSLEASPRDEAHARALALTYLKPVPNQAIAAERLDLPFSTFRRHLGRAVDHVVETLWMEEVG